LVRFAHLFHAKSKGAKERNTHSKRDYLKKIDKVFKPERS